MSSDRDAVDEKERTTSSSDKIPTDELLAELRRLHDELGHVPRVADMDNHGAYSYGVYYNRFGSWIDAVSDAGLETEGPTRGPDPIPEEELLAELQRLHDDLGEVPKTTDMNRHGKYSDVTYRNRFDSWDEAISDAGLDPGEIQRGSNPIPSEELLAELRVLSDEVDGAPRKLDMNAHGEYSADTYRLRFGSWLNALEEAGVR